jgi:para-aminobenzoate synthetase
LRTLLIDNHDSFTYNLFQLLAEENGTEPIVCRNDEASWEELARLEFDNVVLSPGPGRPERRRDFGVCAEAIRRCEAPLLGVCLGHQGLGWIHGGRVVRAPEPMHGRVCPVEHDGSSLFAGIPRRFEATRYHSLCLEPALPAELEAIAWGDDGVVMALAHRARPQWGVQFHPESVATQHGRRLLANFRDLTLERASQPRRGAFVGQGLTKAPRPQADLELRVRRLQGRHDPEPAFVALYGESRDAFWLDSSRVGKGGRFSFMGDAGGPLGATIAYDVGSGEVTVERGGETEVRAEPILDYLERELARLRPLVAGRDAADLPFDFDCGFVGYLGYEVKADCGSPNAHSSPLPDAAFVLADRLIAFDHDLGYTYLLCLCEPEEEQAADSWLSTTAARLAGLESATVAGVTGEGSAEPPRCCSADPSPVTLHLRRSRTRYLEDIAACKEHLLEGESYEVCLTNSVEAEVNADPLDLYLRLREVNPAPFASYLRFGELAVLSSSPERFLRIDADGGVETKPVKGTSRRGESPTEDARLAEELRTSEKNRAENLMIVDLMRNDLGAVCEIGSVEVPVLIEVETYETVHQLVSTVRGRLREGGTALECVRSCFPPGSMTGAPKLRTMEILEELEGRARGVYSGAIGYFGLGGGADLSVTIRTIVLDGNAVSIGAGGAIVLQSAAQNELREALLKARAPMQAIDQIGGKAPLLRGETNFLGKTLSENT